MMVWELTVTAVVSGATDTVMYDEMLSVESVEGPAAKQGIKYDVASGVRIPNLGETKFMGTTAWGDLEGDHSTSVRCEQGAVEREEDCRSGQSSSVR